MTPKEKALAAVQTLPDDATWGQVAEKLAFMAEVERGLLDADEGRTVPHAEVKERLREWLRK